MIAFTLRSTLALVALIAALAAYRATHPVGAALGVIGAVIALASLVVPASFVVSRRHAAVALSDLRLGLPRAARVMLHEWLAYLALFFVIQPFERLWMGEDAAGRSASATAPVLLIHGYLCNRGAWWWIRRKLAAAGITVGTINLEPPRGSIEDYVGPLAARIEALCVATGAAKVALVGHSMGGLAARAYLRWHGAQRIDRLITLATPHHGSFVAYWGIGRNAREMQPASAFIQQLAADDPGVSTLCIWTATDNFVAPQESARLAGAREQRVPASSHLALFFSPRVVEALLNELTHDQIRQR